MILDHLTNSLILTLAATFLGCSIGVCLSISRLLMKTRWRRILDCIAFAQLIIPPFLITEVWMKYMTTSFLGIPPLSIWSCALVLSICLWPISYFVFFDLWNKEKLTTQIISCGLHGAELIYRVIIPFSFPWLRNSIVLVGGMVWCSFTIPSLFNVHVLSAQIWISFNTSLEASSIWIPAVIQSIPPIIILCIFFKKVSFSAHPFQLDSQTHECRIWIYAIGKKILILCALVSFLTLVVSLGLGLLQLIPALIDIPSWVQTIKANQQPLLNSVYTTLIIIPLLLSCCLVLSFLPRLKAIWIFWFLPGICISVAIAFLVNHDWLNSFYNPGMELVFITLIVKFFPLVIFLLAGLIFENQSSALTEYLKTSPISKWMEFSHIHLLRLQRISSGLIIILASFILWEMESIIMIIPPDGETIANRVFGFLHYGHNEKILTLCLTLVVTAALMWKTNHLVFNKLVNIVSKNSRIYLITLVLIILNVGCSNESNSSSTNAQIDSIMFHEVLEIGQKGNSTGRFQKPRSLVVDNDDNLYVSDMTGRIQKFNSAGIFELFWQIEDIELGRPKGMGLDFQGNIMVIEPHYGRINHFSSNGELLHVWGTKGKIAGQLDLPRAILKFDHNQFVLCEFGGHDRLQWFKDDGTFTGKQCGQNGTGESDLDRPEGLAFDKDGNILVADSCNHRIQIFSKEGKWVSSFGNPGTGPLEFSYPYDVKVDKAGNIYICEFGNSRIQILDKNKTFIETIGKQGRSLGDFFNPWTISFDSKENLYVADSMNHRVQKFIRKPQESPNG